MGDCVLFITSNGAGLGHLTRAMAVARRLPSGIRPVIFTLSQGAPLVRQQGFFVEYLPSPEYIDGRQPRWRTRMRWNILFRERLLQIINVFDPSVAIFDGTFPYKGLVDAMEATSGVQWVWCRRGMWRRDRGTNNLERTPFFDWVIEPGEFAADADEGLTAAHRDEALSFDPICYLEPEELLERAEAERRLGLDPAKLHAFVQLGAGNINDIESLAGRCAKLLLEDRRVELVLAESAIAGKTLERLEGVVTVREYPLARYFNAFDVCVSAAGYNTYHELIAHRVPSLFIPNTNTALDDQMGRARFAERSGVGLCCEELDPTALAKSIARLLDDRERERMKGALERVSLRNGASSMAGFVSNLLQDSRG